MRLCGFYDRIANLGYFIEISDKAKDFIAEQGFDQQFGARPLKRALQKYLEDGLADMMLDARLQPGDTIMVNFDEEKKEITTDVRHPEPINLEEPS